MDKTIKLVISEDEYNRYLEDAKAEGLSVSAYVKRKMNKPKYTLQKAIKARGREEQRQQQRQQYRKKDSKLSLVSDDESDSAGSGVVIGGYRDPVDVDYTSIGDRCYPLWYSKRYGIRSPSLGFEDVFWFDMMYAKRDYYYDVTSSLSPLELEWFEAWANNFEHMDRLWWFRARTITGEGRSWKQEDVECLLNWFSNGKSLDELDREAGLATASFKDKLKALDERIKLDKEHRKECQRILDTNEYEKLKEEREHNSKKARLAMKREMDLGLKLGLLRPSAKALQSNQ